MSQQKLINFLVVQSTYQDVQIGFFTDEQERERVAVDKTIASKKLLTELQTLLARNNCQLQDLSCIVVNQGPGPFTTLRTVIATVNGLAFAAKVPLIGVDGFDALLVEVQKPETIHAILLNAFNRDVYFAISAYGTVEKGYRNIDLLLDALQVKFPDQQISFCGNGSSLYKAIILEKMGSQALILPAPDVPSLAALAQLGVIKFSEGVHEAQLIPLYLKKAVST